MGAEAAMRKRGNFSLAFSHDGPQDLHLQRRRRLARDHVIGAAIEVVSEFGSPGVASAYSDARQSHGRSSGNIFVARRRDRT